MDTELVDYAAFYATAALCKSAARFRDTPPSNMNMFRNRSVYNLARYSKDPLTLAGTDHVTDPGTHTVASRDNPDETNKPADTKRRDHVYIPFIFMARS